MDHLTSQSFSHLWNGMALPNLFSHMGGGELIPGKALNREELINDLVEGGRALQNTGTLQAEPEASIFFFFF